jgi:hypothetical protein
VREPPWRLSPVADVQVGARRDGNCREGAREFRRSVPLTHFL